MEDLCNTRPDKYQMKEFNLLFIGLSLPVLVRRNLNLESRTEWCVEIPHVQQTSYFSYLN